MKKYVIKCRSMIDVVGNIKVARKIAREEAEKRSKRTKIYILDYDTHEVIEVIKRKEEECKTLENCIEYWYNESKRRVNR